MTGQVKHENNRRTGLPAHGEDLCDRMLRIPAIDVGVFEHNFRANATPATVGHLNHTRALLIFDPRLMSRPIYFVRVYIGAARVDGNRAVRRLPTTGEGGRHELAKSNRGHLCIEQSPVFTDIWLFSGPGRCTL